MKTRKIAICANYGGWDISEKVITRYNELTGNNHKFGDHISRDDPFLIQAIEELGQEANTPWCNIKILEIPFDVDWQIQDYDGREWIAERHRTWE